MFECVESSFSFNRGPRQGSVEAPKLWQMMATQLLATVEKEENGSTPGFRRRRGASDMQLYVDPQLLDCVPLKEKLEAMLRDLFVEAARWDLGPKPACP